MPITGLGGVVVDNGVSRISSFQASASATIDGVTLVLDSPLSAVSSTGTITITNSNIHMDSDVNTGNDALGKLNYNGRAATNDMILRESSVVLSTTALRVNIQASEFTNTNVSQESGLSMFVYSATSAIINTSTFNRIKVHEIFGNPGTFFRVTYNSTEIPWLNWEAGVISLYEVVNNTPTSGFSGWLGAGNAGNNSVDIINSTYDISNILHQSVNGQAFRSFSISWEFSDGAVVQNVLVIHRDDRVAPGGALTEQSRTTSDVSGHIGILLTRLEETQIAGGTFATGLVDPAIAQNITVDTLITNIEIRSYNHLVPGGFEDTDTFVPSAQIGQLGPTGTTVASYQQFSLNLDQTVTLSQAAALALTTITTLDELYDRIKAEWRTVDGFPYGVNNNGTLDLLSTNLVIDGTAGAAYAFAGNTITINSLNLQAGLKLQLSVTTTGTITTVNGAITSGIILIDSTGTSSVFQLQNVINSTVYIQDNLGVQQIYQTGFTGTFNYNVSPGSTGTWTYVVKRPGYTFERGIFTPGGIQTSDIEIFQSINPTTAGPLFTGSSSGFTTVTMGVFGSSLTFIDIGNGSVTAQTIWDETETALDTASGMKWIADSGDRISFQPTPLGNFIVLNTNWRFRRDLPGSAAATVLAFVQTLDVGGIITDESNGSVQFITSNTVLTAQDIRNAMLLAPVGSAVATSIDQQLADIQTSVTPLPTLPASRTDVYNSGIISL